MSDETFLAIGNEELASRPSVEAGDRVRPGRCDHVHVLDGHGPLLTYRCGESSYLAGLDGALLAGLAVEPRP